MKETKNIDLNTLIHRPLKAFFDRRIEPSDISPADEEEKIIPTTFRLPADIKNYYQMMGDASRTTALTNLLIPNYIYLKLSIMLYSCFNMT